MTTRLRVFHRAVRLGVVIGVCATGLAQAESEPVYALDAEVPDTAVVAPQELGDDAGESASALELSDGDTPTDASVDGRTESAAESATADETDSLSDQPEADSPAQSGDTVADPSTAQAASEPNEVDRLRTYIAAGDVFHARFVQSVYSESGALQRESTGDVTLAPPSRFRWTYETPFPQLIVSDGEEIFIYDQDLQQVTIYDSNEALRSSPTLIFRDPEALDRSFAMLPLASEDDMDWVELTPRDVDADFDVIFVALDPIGIRVLEFRDKLGQATQIRFDRVETTRSVSDAVFAFEIPEEADVIRP